MGRPSEKAITQLLCRSTVEIVEIPEIDDMWIRDTGPTFVRGAAGESGAVDFNFNGWGGKQEHAKDAKVAKFVADTVGAQRLTTFLKMEGGAIEVDENGTAIITESCVLNNNRNPGVSKAEADAELRRLLGVSKIIWLPGIAGKDITDGHTDFYARFVRPGVVVAAYDPNPESYDHNVTKRHLEILRSATDAMNRPLEVHVLNAPNYLIIRGGAVQDFAAGYINYYLCNGALIMPEFGDCDADRAAVTKLRTLYPGRTVVALNIDGIASGGGGIHCATQQEPRGINGTSGSANVTSGSTTGTSSTSGSTTSPKSSTVLDAK